MERLRQIWHQRLGWPFRLAYQQSGSGTDTVILLHGIAADGNFWRPLLDPLDQTKYRVIVPDLLGHGASPAPAYIQYSSADQAAAVWALCRRLHIKRCIVVGHSMGCLVATRLATQHPALVQRLLLYEPPLFTDMPEFKTRRRREQFYLNLFERIAANPAGTFTVARLVARLAQNWTRHLANDQTWLPIERSLRNSIMQSTGYEELCNITIATDIIHGRLDVVVPRGDLKKQLAHNKNIRFYRTTDRHRMSRASARYLAKLIASSGQSADNAK